MKRKILIVLLIFIVVASIALIALPRLFNHDNSSANVSDAQATTETIESTDTETTENTVTAEESNAPSSPTSTNNWVTELDDSGKITTEYLVANTWWSIDGDYKLTFDNNGVATLIDDKAKITEIPIYFTDFKAIKTDPRIANGVVIANDKPFKWTQTVIDSVSSETGDAGAAASIPTDCTISTNAFGNGLIFCRLMDGSEFVLTNADDNLRGYVGDLDTFRTAFAKWSAENTPTATSATWSQTITRDYSTNSATTEFTLNNSSMEKVMVTFNTSTWTYQFAKGDA